MGRVEVADDDPIADVGPGSLANEPEIEAFLRGEAAFDRHDQAGAIEQRDKSDNHFHRNSPAAVMTAWAISTTRLLSLIAALRNRAYAASSVRPRSFIRIPLARSTTLRSPSACFAWSSSSRRSLNALKRLTAMSTTALTRSFFRPSTT